MEPNKGEETLNPVIELENISKQFNGKIVLNQINLSIYKGKVLGITGENGSGKSTLIKIIAGLIEPDIGEVLINEDIAIEIVLEGSRNFYWNLTGYENLSYFSTLFNIKNKRERILDIIKLMDMEDFIDLISGSYSRGMQQKLSISLSLLNKPNLLILDEPTNGLDEKSVYKLIELIKRLKGEMNIGFLIVSHDRLFLEAVLDDEFCLETIPVERMQGAIRS